MTNRERMKRVLHYQSYDRLPIVHFGFWYETLQKWCAEGHITTEQASHWGDGNTADVAISKLLGFDCNWSNQFGGNTNLMPGFESKVIKQFPDGSRHVMNGEGVIELDVPGAVSIRSEIEHTLKDRASWEEHYKHRLQWSEDRVTKSWVRVSDDKMLRWDQGGMEWLKNNQRDFFMGIWCGSMYGNFRNIIGVENSAYLLMDDEPLFDEILDTYAELAYRSVEYILTRVGAVYDFAHWWEDICFKTGPLVQPDVFREKVGPHYKRITDLLKRYDIDIVSLDCDGCIDALVPIWLENGVNTMFPIEVGTWNASIEPWRKQYGRDLRGVGGMNKVVFGRDRSAIDAEVQRLRKLVDLGGYIPCPDHRIAPDGQWDLVRYYCDRMHQVFG